ncbi:MAG: LPS assembly protein LptD, partial [Oligoflexia bacterium]|nr:LPS assembly protein LptD [Oligoflexia bacterium]
GGNFFGNYINDSRYGFEPKFLTPDRRYWNQGSYNLPFENRQVENYIPRYSLHYDHHYELPHGFTNNMEVNLVRDSHYPYDFPDDILGQGNPSLENRLSIAKNFENSHASADIGVYQNLIKADPVGGNEAAIHRVPELKYSLLPQHIAISDFLLSFDLNYLNLNRMDKNGQITANTSTQTVTNGSYRTGQRVNAKPTLKYPMVFGRYLDLVPELQYEESFYQFGYSTKPTTTRRYVRTSLLAKTRLSAVLGEPQEVKATRYKHQIEPDILYTQVPYLYQADHPFFGQIAANDTNYSSGQPITEFDNLQFDYRDRLVDRHVVTFGLTNKLVRKKWNGESVEYFEIIRHRLSQSYDIFNTYQANPADLSTADTTDVIQVIRQPWSDIRSLLNMRIDNFNLHSDVSYFPYQNVYSQSSSVGIRDDRGNGFDVGYAQRFSYARDRNNLPTKLLDLNSRSEALTFSLYLASKYLDLASVTGYNLAQGLFTSQTFSGLLKPPGECWGIEFRFKKTFGGANAEYTINLPIFFGEGRSFNTSTGSI